MHKITGIILLLGFADRNFRVGQRRRSGGRRHQRAYTENFVTPDTAWLLALFDLGGYPVRQEVSMRPVRMWAELVSVEEKSAPGGTYDIPAGYSGCD